MPGAVPGGAVVPFRVLVVCTANICRSPLAEVVLSSQLAEAGAGAEVVVGGAGVGRVARDGLPMHPVSAEIARRWARLPSGEELPLPLSRRLSSRVAGSVDLVLTMTAAHRDRVLRDHPRLMTKAFTLAEYARLAEALLADEALGLDAQLAELGAADRFRLLTRKAHNGRPRVRLTADDDVPDPVDGDRALHEAVADQIAGYCAAVASIGSVARTS